MAGKRQPNWETIKAEYLRGGTSYAKLATKHGVSCSTLTKRAIRESWESERQQIGSEVAAEIHRAAVASRVMSAQEVLEEFSRIARGGMQAIATWGSGGLVLKESAELSPDEAATIAEVAETRTETGGSLRIKQYDKLAALDKLARHYGLYAEKGGDPGNGNGSNPGDPRPVSRMEELRALDASELDRRIGEALRAGRGGQR